MATLDYQSPNQQPKTDWARRYRIYVPIFAGIYVVVLLGSSFVIGLQYMDVPPGSVPRSVEVFFALIGFPLFTLFPDVNSKNLPVLLLVLVINACVWGAAIVGLWHAIGAIHSRYGRNF